MSANEAPKTPAKKARKRTLAQRLGRLLERLTHQSGRPDTPAYGSWLLGRVSENQRRRRVRIQIILTVLGVTANVLGIAVARYVLKLPMIAEATQQQLVDWAGPSLQCCLEGCDIPIAGRGRPALLDGESFA